VEVLVCRSDDPGVQIAHSIDVRRAGLWLRFDAGLRQVTDGFDSQAQARSIQREDQGGDRRGPVWGNRLPTNNRSGVDRRLGHVKRDAHVLRLVVG
jgi:hypothetical protein